MSTNAITFSTVAPHTTAPPGVNISMTLTGSFTEPGFANISTERENTTFVQFSGPPSGSLAGGGSLTLGSVDPRSPTTLAKRAHTTTITVCVSMNVRSCTENQIAGSPQVINITYNVGGIEASTPALAFSVGNSPTPDDLAKTFDVTGHLIPSWSASATTATNPTWLSLAPTMGDTTAPTTVTASLIQSAIDALENGNYSGTVSLTPSEGMARSIAVSLALQRTRVNYVAPYVALANVAAEVIIRGENFTQFAPTSVEFGPGNVASAFTVDSNTQIRATHPALAAGSYPVRVINGTGAASTRAHLVVVEPPASTSQSLQYPGGPGVTPTVLIYDAERRAIFVGLARFGAYSIARFAYTGAWNPPVGVPIPSPHAAALSANGSALFVAYDDTSIFRFALAELDPATLVQTKVTRYTAEMEGDGIAVSNNGRAIIKTEMLCCSGSFPMLSYDPLTSALTLLPSPFVTLFSAGIGGSGDGSTILVATDDQSSPLVTPLLRYDSELRALVDSTGDIESLSPRMVLNRRGTHMLVRNLNGLQLLLAAPPNTVVGTLGANTLDAAFSPTADIVYVYDSTETLTAYDLATGTALATGLTIAGTGNVAALVTVSPDGGTVFVAGDQKLAVVPAADVPE